jgi:hypothetical protein
VATVVVVGEDGPALAAALDGIDAAGARIGVAPLARRGAVARVLARSAPALREAVAGLWGRARGALLGLSPLSRRPG